MSAAEIDLSMLTNAIRPMLLVATLLPSLTFSSTFAVPDKPKMYPIFRYAMYEENESVSEYLGVPDGPFADNFRQLPNADGPMEVDCRTLSEIGIVIEPVGAGGWIYGAKTKYRFRWSHSTALPDSVEHMQYRRNTPHGFLRHGIILTKWLVNGNIRLWISVENQVVYETDFKLNDCAANLYRSPTPPSQIRRHRDTLNQDEEDSVDDLPQGAT